MNPAELSIKNPLLLSIVALIFILGGYIAYQNMPRFEDPEFTIRTAQILTRYPGASPLEVANEIAEPLETALQEMQEVEEIRSTSRSGFSEISVDIKYEFSRSKSDLQLIWTKVRNKITDAQGELPPGAEQSIVFDDFGDVYGVYYLLTGEGYSPKELYEYAKSLRIALLQVDGVGKVTIAGEQDEAIYVEISRERAAALGLSTFAIFDSLQTQNAVVGAGAITLNDQRIEIVPSGSIDSVAHIENLAIRSGADGQIIYLRNVANVVRGFRDPATLLIRYDGKPAIAIGVSNVTGANVVKMGDGIAAKITAVDSQRPVGMTLHEFYHQGKVVNASVQDFAFNVFLALLIVIGALLVFMGWRAAGVIGAVLLLTIAATLMTMNLIGIPMHRISLGALIIALGMLVDNAIVVAEGILVNSAKNTDRLDVAKKVIDRTKWPLLGGTLVGVIAFAPIGFAPGATAEYTNHLFWVILISLAFSWIFALSVTPFLCYHLFTNQRSTDEDQDGTMTRLFKSVLRRAISIRWVFLTGAVGIFMMTMWAFQFVKSGFFPASTTPQVVLDYWLPEGADIERTNEDMRALEEYAMSIEGVTGVQTLVGRGALRYMLVYQFESQNPAYGQLLIKVENFNRIKNIIPELQSHVDDNYPDAQGRAWRFVLGPGGGSKIEATFKGPDPVVLRQLANKAKSIMAADGRAVSIKDDWRDPVSIITPIYDEDAGRRLAVSREEFANGLQRNFSGLPIGTFRDKDTLIPIIARAPKNEQAGIQSILNMSIISSVTGNAVPVVELTNAIETKWRDAQINRVDREWTIKAQCDPRENELASVLLGRIRADIEAIELAPGYSLTWDGEIGSSSEANSNLFSTVPYTLLAMLLIIIVLFNALRPPLVIWLGAPLAIVGVAVGLITMQTPLEFMGILGVLSLIGLLFKNAIVLIEEMNLQLQTGLARADAIVNAAASRARPVILGALTTVLGVAPLYFDPFFKSMAVVLVFGLSFATILTLLVMPVIYAAVYGIKASETAT